MICRAKLYRPHDHPIAGNQAKNTVLIFRSSIIVLCPLCGGYLDNVISQQKLLKFINFSDWPNRAVCSDRDGRVWTSRDLKALRLVELNLRFTGSPGLSRQVRWRLNVESRAAAWKFRAFSWAIIVENNVANRERQQTKCAMKILAPAAADCCC